MIKYSSFVLAALLAFTGCGGGGGSDSGSGTNPQTTGVVINEVLADNNSTNTDPDLGLYGDWIELKNLSTSAINLAGYGLSDSEKKIKWTFPAGTQLGANELLLVWADDLNTTLHPNPIALHTNFKLKSNDDKVVLYDVSGKKLSVLNLKDHKVTKSDVSIARDVNGDYVLLTTPTPGAENSSDAVTVSKTPDFSHKEGVYKAPSIDVTITAGNGASIYYTVDGTDATLNSTQYTAPVNISQNKTTLKAVAKEQGNTIVSKEKSKTYVIVAENDRDIIINEIFSDNNATAGEKDWVELKNISGNNIADLSNYKLSDKKKLDPANAVKILSGSIAAGALKVIEIDKNSDGFAFSDKGDSAVLYKNTTIIDFKDFGKLKDVSYSRQGGAWDNNFTKTTTITKGAPNAQ
jgi:hypothetical protein